MQGPGLQNRDQNEMGRISRKHESAFMHALRKISEAIFAAGLPENTTLSDALEKLDATSLSKPHRYEAARQRTADGID